MNEQIIYNYLKDNTEIKIRCKTEYSSYKLNCVSVDVELYLKNPETDEMEIISQTTDYVSP